MNHIKSANNSSTNVQLRTRHWIVDSSGAALQHDDKCHQMPVQVKIKGIEQLRYIPVEFNPSDKRFVTFAVFKKAQARIRLIAERSGKRDLHIKSDQILTEKSAPITEEQRREINARFNRRMKDFGIAAMTEKPKPKAKPVATVANLN